MEGQGPARAASRTATLALLAVVVAGGLVSLQVFVNGRMAGELDSAALAGVVNHATGLAALLAVGITRGVPARARRALVGAPRPRWWYVVGGVNGALFIILAGYAAPRVGVALLTVAFVCGQTAGSVVLDRRGMSPAGVRPLTTARLLGALLALAAVIIGAVGSSGHVEIGLLALALLTGAGVAVQQAAMGHMAALTGEPMAAGALNISVGLAALLVAAAVMTGFTAPGGWSAPPLDWTGGLLGAVAATTVAAAVPRLGVLQMMLAFVAGQSIGGLVLDLLAPPPGEHVTVATVLSVALTIVAVLISSGALARRGRATIAVEHA